MELEITLLGFIVDLLKAIISNPFNLDKDRQPAYSRYIFGKFNNFKYKIIQVNPNKLQEFN